MCLKLDFHNEGPIENKTIQNRKQNILLKVTQAFGGTSLTEASGETACEHILNVWEAVERLPEAGCSRSVLQNNFCLKPCEIYNSYNCILTGKR